MKSLTSTLVTSRILASSFLLSSTLMYFSPLQAQTTDDHAQYNMQQSPSADARDPHAYANGNTLDSGAYALPGPRSLKFADEHNFWSLMGDRLETDSENDSAMLELEAWYGTSYDRFVVKVDADVEAQKLEALQAELLWRHAISTFFDSQLGVRVDDYDNGERRQWLALGVQGLAPYWFEVDVTGYIGDAGRTALSLSAEYELLITQKLILQPSTEWTLYGQKDDELGLGSGLSAASLGLRLRYEITRQFAPYIGVEWQRKFGATADIADLEGQPVSDTRYVVGLRFWF